MNGVNKGSLTCYCLRSPEEVNEARVQQNVLSLFGLMSCSVQDFSEFSS